MDETIEIPENVLVRCPKVGFNMARLARCADCVSFDGLADRFPGSVKPFAARYLLQCRHEPVKRELTELSEVAA